MSVQTISERRLSLLTMQPADDRPADDEPADDDPADDEPADDEPADDQPAHAERLSNLSQLEARGHSASSRSRPSGARAARGLAAWPGPSAASARLSPPLNTGSGSRALTADELWGFPCSCRDRPAGKDEPGDQKRARRLDATRASGSSGGLCAESLSCRVSCRCRSPPLAR